MSRNSTQVFAQIEREIHAIEKEKVGTDFSARDVFLSKDKRFKRKKGLKKIFYFIRSLFYRPQQNKPKFVQKERDILRIIKEYNPKIREQCINNEKYFFQWERENRSGRSDLGWILKKEEEAWSNAELLYKEEQEKLMRVNEMIRFLHPMHKKLNVGHEGWKSIKNGLAYLDFLESFFEERIKKLEIA